MDRTITESAKIIFLFSRMLMRRDLNLPVRPSEMGVLIYTYESEAPPTPRMVSDYFRMRKPSVTSMVKSLATKGYLRKAPSEIDQRSYTLICTKKGEQLVTSTFEEYHRSISHLKESMGDEAFDTLVTLMQQANRILDEERQG